MLQVLYMDIAYVAVAIYVCCKCMLQMFHLFQTYIESVSSRCCICCNVEYVANVYSKCFICLRHTMQLYLDVVVAIYICCKRMFVNVSPV
jgi:hypothetical protein